MGVSDSAWRIAYTVCSSENFDRFIGQLLSWRTTTAAIVLEFQPAIFSGETSHIHIENPVKYDAMLNYPLVFRLKLDLMRPTPPFIF